MRLPLATSIQSRDGTLAKDSKLVNAFVETQGEEAAVFKRPGLDLRFELGALQGQGLICWNGHFYAIGGNTAYQDPVNFSATQGTMPTATYWKAVAYGNSTFVAVTNQNSLTNPTDVAATSANGTSWTNRTMPVAAKWSDVTFGNGIFVAIATSTSDVAATSADGITWTQRTLPVAANWTSVTYGNGTFVAVAFNSSIAATSPDGITWTQRTLPVSANWKAVKYGTTFSAVARDSTIAATSSDGITWTQRTLPVTGAWEVLEYGAGLFVTMEGSAAGSASNVALTSPDGITWTQRTLPVSSKWNALAFGGSKFIALGESFFACVTSFDGITWDSQTTPVNATWEGVVYGTNTFVSVAPSFGNTPAGFDTLLINAGPAEHTYALSGAGSLPISFANTSGAASTEYLVLKVTNKAWVLTVGTPGTLTQITDADYPATTVPGVVYLDGYFFVMDADGVIYNSDLEAPLAWNPLNFISAEIEPDTAIAIAKHQNYVVAFKDTTTELFYDAANASGSPLARLSNAALQIGCGNGYSIANLDGGLFFISKTRSRGLSVHFFAETSLQPTEIATPGIQRILNASTLTTVHCFAARLAGHGLYVINLVSDGITLVYDLQSQSWAQWTYLTVQASKSITSLTQSNGIATATCTGHGYSDGDPVTIAGATPSGYNGDVNITRVDANTFTYPVDNSLSTPATGTITAVGYTTSYFPFGFFTECGGVDYVQHETSGELFAIGLEYADDEGVPIDVLIRTPKIDLGNGDRKSMHSVQVVGDQITGNLLARYVDDDYQTFSTYRQVSLAQEKAQIRRLGQFRRRAMDFRYTGSGKLRITAIDADIEQGK